MEWNWLQEFKQLQEDWKKAVDSGKPSEMDAVREAERQFSEKCKQREAGLVY